MSRDLVQRDIAHWLNTASAHQPLSVQPPHQHIIQQYVEYKNNNQKSINIFQTYA